jgi:hypothetical protein
VASVFLNASVYFDISYEYVFRLRPFGPSNGMCFEMDGSVAPMFVLCNLSFRNHHFYEKHGFKKVGETQPEADGFYLFQYEKTSNKSIQATAK